MPGGDASSAFESRLSSTCSTRPSPARTTAPSAVRLERHAPLLRERRPQLDTPADDVTERQVAASTAGGVRARELEQLVDQARQALDLDETRLPLSPFSSRSRSAVSGVRSSCDASATNCSCDLRSAASLAVVRLNSPARRRTSDGPSSSAARAVSSPAPTRAATPSSRRSGRAIERASSSPTVRRRRARSSATATRATR